MDRTSTDFAFGAAASSDPERTVVLIFRADGHLLVRCGDPAEFPDCAPPGLLLHDRAAALHIGTLSGAPVTAHWGREEEPAGYEYRSLRDLIGELGPDLATIASRARQLLEWDCNHRHCGRCGEATETMDGERAKRCPSCGHTAYPRINPAIIVAITRGDTLLLARNRRFRNNMHSIIAGFVEAGESLEQTLRREIAEEVGLEVHTIRYVNSQSWPFPNTLMVGFTAEHAHGEIRVDGEEIVAAGWYTRNKLPPIPRRGSLSRELIESVLGPIEDEPS